MTVKNKTLMFKIKLILVSFRADLKVKNIQLIHKYDTEMMEKYKNIKEFNLKIKLIEDNIIKLGVS